ncbi:uncharacterized protein LOC115620423 [Scaptodrosophila lebanonensis]|uniref:Uncharacterized protein LOC115620423 n=1 Tax=Drosophila lebanonensis TaxID=7225 RepID=A0A6J2T0E2_DROLE|nr:uncharacterized protein LOC115620423 [Scaptodrosophila lebanonensis]
MGRVCHEHFRTEDIIGSMQCAMGIKRRRLLKKGAIPVYKEKQDGSIPESRRKELIAALLKEDEASISCDLNPECNTPNTMLGSCKNIEMESVDLGICIKEECDSKDMQEFISAPFEVDNGAGELHTTVSEKAPLNTENVPLTEWQSSPSADIKPDVSILNLGMEPLETEKLNTSKVVIGKPLSWQNAVKYPNANVIIVVEERNAKSDRSSAGESANESTLVRIEKLKIENTSLQIANKKLSQRLRKQQLRFDQLLRKKCAEYTQTKTELQRAQYFSRNMEALLLEIVTQGQLKKIKHGGRRLCWSAEDIANSFALYTKSPQGYRLLQEKKFPLPCLRTLRRWAKGIKMNSK